MTHRILFSLSKIFNLKRKCYVYRHPYIYIYFVAGRIIAYSVASPVGRPWLAARPPAWAHITKEATVGDRGVITAIDAYSY
jgi:hypothetical protein